MNFTQIQTFVCAKVSKTDAYSQARCMDYITARDKMIYEGFDWKTAQILVDKTIAGGAGTKTVVTMPEVHHCLAVRLDGVTLDPATPSYIFDNTTGTTDNYSTAGKPLMYDEQYVVATGVRQIRFFPPLADTGVSHSLSVLGKAPYAVASAPTIPQTESALIAFVIGDMWEYLHQVGKAQSKFTEGQGLLQAAQQADTPPPMRARLSKALTPTGNSLGELTDAVCDIISDWTPPTRVSVKDRIRRNYHKIWDSALWPETTVASKLTAVNSIAIVPHLIDKVLGVRVNVDAANLVFQTLSYADPALFLQIQPNMFEQLGTPMRYSLLLPVGINAVFTQQGFKLKLVSNEKASVFLKGESLGAPVFETVAATQAGVTSINLYDMLYTFEKPVTSGALQIQDLAGNVLDTLGANEQQRKYSRIQLYPAFDPTASPTPDQSVLVLGKRRIPQLMDDGDTTVLRGIENALVSAAAADMLLKSGKADVAQTYREDAASSLAILVDRETRQAAYQPCVVPYTEPSSWLNSGDCIGYSIP